MLSLRKISLAVVVLFSALVLSACKSLYNNSTGGQTSQGQQQETQQTETVQPSEGGVSITATDAGFEPSPATVKSGETITWVNDSSETVQVGSANHPTHTINQEIVGNKFVIELAPGKSQTIVVTKTGSWGYHNHLSPSATGVVIVE